ncbi:hypothetical protein Enr10x_40450 [Gimesia panareensis]|uniref:Uncharacterized protein n=1 Tax=Gimesia panareensis TaxID=2527978 RepID=A0A517QAP5_9PLAN|nr:hypothetical protein Enr10x_40450 [Gimesia panareensis]
MDGTRLGYQVIRESFRFCIGFIVARREDTWVLPYIFF